MRFFSRCCQGLRSPLFQQGPVPRGGCRIRRCGSRPLKRGAAKIQPKDAVARFRERGVGYQRASVRPRFMNEVEGVVIADEREAEGACAVGEPQGPLRAPRVLREARKYPGAGDLDRVVRSDRVEAADVTGEPGRVLQCEFPAAAGERGGLAGLDDRVRTPAWRRPKFGPFPSHPPPP